MITKNEARQKFIAEARASSVGEQGALSQWVDKTEEELYRDVLTGRTPEGFKAEYAIQAVTSDIQRGILGDVTMKNNLLIVRNGFSGRKSVYNSILGLAQSHKKRRTASSLEIDLFEKE